MTMTLIVQGQARLVPSPDGYNHPLPTCTLCNTSMGYHSGCYTCINCDRS